MRLTVITTAIPIMEDMVSTGTRMIVLITPRTINKTVIWKEWWII
jgi:hypothetical protein